jgi:hypothetical protein
MNPRFGPAWIAFAHSFAMEKEHDQAITAYSTATRLFQGSVSPSPLPPCFQVIWGDIDEQRSDNSSRTCLLQISPATPLYRHGASPAPEHVDSGG